MTFTNLCNSANEHAEPDWLVVDILECGTHSMLFGDPESGKTLVLFDLLWSIAAGRKWRGRPVKQGAVFYLCGEGAAGLGRRAAAWKHHNGMGNAVDLPFYSSNIPAALTDEDSARMIVEVIKEMCEQENVTPVAIGIDTLARNFGPGDENSAKDIGQFVANLDNHLIGDLGAAVITSHHTGHGDKDRARGSMSLPGAVDTSYCISKNEKIIQMECKKSKDFGKPVPMLFDLVVVNLPWQDRYGRVITGATVDSVQGDKFQSGRPILKGNDLTAFDLLVNTYQRTQRHLEREGKYNAHPVIDMQYWKTELNKKFDKYGHGPGSEGWNNARKTTNRVVARLTDSKHVSFRPNKRDIYPTYLG